GRSRGVSCPRTSRYRCRPGPAAPPVRPCNGIAPCRRDSRPGRHIPPRPSRPRPTRPRAIASATYPSPPRRRAVPARWGRRAPRHPAASIEEIPLIAVLPILEIFPFFETFEAWVGAGAPGRREAGQGEQAEEAELPFHREHPPAMVDRARGHGP